MSLYEILLFVHVLAVAIWVGGATMFHVLIERAAAADDPVRIKGLMGEAEHLAKTYFIPSTIIVLVMGIWLVLEGSWGFDEPFVLGGIVGIVITIAVGAGVLGPTSMRIAARITEVGGLDQGIRDQMAKLKNISRADLLLLAVIVFLMTTKPGT
ncbi:MAG: DUF2269 family protein [Actinomycetota bacterium]|nr:DUF2269 family protein [Actinomycetota bacterium]